MITVWGRQSSSNVQAVMWCISELNLPHQRLDAGLHYGVVNSEDYRAINPNGTVPTLQDGEEVTLFESGAIIRYLASEYGSEDFWPSTPKTRTPVDQWTEWSKLNIALKFTAPIFWQVVRTPKERQDADKIRHGVTTFEKNLAIAEERLTKHDYLAGPNFTPADIQFGHVLYRYYDMPIQRAKLPATQDYYTRLTQRQPYQQHVMVPYEELRDTL